MEKKARAESKKFREIIGQKVRGARESMGVTQQQVADSIHVSRAYYADVERGRYAPSIRILSKLGNIMDIDLNFLKENDGNKIIDGNKI